MCKLAAGRAVSLLAFGGSNTMGRWRPRYYTELGVWLNSAFPVTVGRGRHLVHNVGHSGSGVRDYTSRDQFGKVADLIMKHAVDMVLVETAPNDAVAFLPSARVLVPPAWSDDSHVKHLPTK